MEEMESCGSGVSPSPAATTRMQAMELLDHYWFFYNILSPPPPLPDHPPEEVIAIQHGELNSSLPETPKPPEQCQARPSRQLSRQSSLPPGIGKPQPANHHEQDAVSITSPTKGSTLAKRKKKLHRSYTSLGDAAPSPIISSSAESSRRQSYKQCCESNDKARIIEEGKNYNWEKDQWRDKLLLGARKWKSFTDLEHEELQGFKDLGFVFGSGDELSPVLLKMIPGLRDREVSGSEVARRPYLSEAWFVQRSAPPLLNWHGRKSRKEMKEQLRFWARAVASNVRQEC